MGLKEDLLNRSSACELCGSALNLEAFEVAPGDETAQTAILVCDKCMVELAKNDSFDEAHLRCLNDSMWSTEPAVQVAVYRLLKKMGSQELLEQMYLEPRIQEWAEQVNNGGDSDTVFKDAFGAVLQAGDTVTIIKDLDVKGAGFVAKRGTAVRNISLTNDPEHIEGRVNGVKIYLKTCFLKKS